MEKQVKCTEYLKYEFSEDELRDKGKELARENGKKTEVEQKKVALMAQLKEQITAADANIGTLARQISNGYEYRNIDCEVKFNDPRTGLKTIVRLDSGEVVKEVAMSTSEMQENLPFVPVEQIAEKVVEAINADGEPGR